MTFGTLLVKEFTQLWRTRRAVVLPVLFLFFGILNPVMLHMMPKLLESQGLNITIPPPTPEQAVGEYYDSVSGLLAIGVVLVSMGMVAEEKSRGTAEMVLSKPVKHSSFIVAKFTAHSVLAVSSFSLGAAICAYYAQLLIGTLSFLRVAESMVLMAVFLIFLVSLVLLFSTLFRSQVIAGFASLVAFFGLGILPSLSRALRSTAPHGLYKMALESLSGPVEGAWTGVLSVAVTSAVLVAASFLLLERQEI